MIYIRLLMLLPLALAVPARSDNGPVTMRPAALAKLESLAGEWTGSASFRQEGEPDSSSPLKGTFRWVLRKYHLEGTLQYQIEGRSYEAMLVWSYDSHANQYRLYWFHNFSSDSAVFSGGFRSGALVMTSRARQAGRTVSSEVRLTVTPPDRWTMQISGGPEGEVRSRTTLAAVRSK